MSRTERLKALINAEIDRLSEQIDKDDRLQKFVVTVKLNDAGYGRSVYVERESFTDLSSLPKGVRLTASVTSP